MNRTIGRMTLWTLPLLALSVSGCQSNCPGVEDAATTKPPVQGFSGVWKTSYGDIYLPKGVGNEVRGAFWSYPDSNGQADNGRIVARIDGNSLDGYWIEDSGDYPCETERDGSSNWGPVHFKANEDFTEITGAWGICDQAPAGDDAAWVGIRD